MKRDRVSRGAQAAALIRAIESYLPEEERLFEDDLASRFLKDPPYRVSLELMRFPSLRAAVMAMWDWQVPGAVGNLLCRTRFIDDALRAALAEGLDQVVILGAGFDSRAYRIDGIERTRVFEVERPSTQDWKQARLKQTPGGLPSHVVFVPIDFDRQKLEDEMAAAGFRIGAKTFFIWEGVTQYITAEAVDATFRYMSRAAAPGSRIVFTYIQRGIIDGSPGFEHFQKAVSLARRIGESWIFGIDPAELRQYLAARGFALVEQVGAPEYQERYLKPLGRQMKVFEGELTVLAGITDASSKSISI